MPFSSTEYSALVASLSPKLSGFPGIVVAIDGRLGVGKTSLGRFLAWHFNVTLLETDLFLKGDGHLSYHTEELKRIIAHRTGRPLPVIVEGVAIRSLLNSIGLKPDVTIYVRNVGETGESSVPEYLAAYERMFNPLETSDFFVNLSH